MTKQPNAQIHWPKDKIIEGFPIDQQPVLGPGVQVDAAWNPATAQYEAAGAIIDGKYHRFIDRPKAQP